MVDYIEMLIAQKNMSKKTKLFVIWWYAQEKEWWKLEELASNFGVGVRTVQKYHRDIRRAKMMAERWDTRSQKKEFKLV